MPAGRTHTRQLKVVEELTIVKTVFVVRTRECYTIKEALEKKWKDRL